MEEESAIESYVLSVSSSPSDDERESDENGEYESEDETYPGNEHDRGP